MATDRLPYFPFYPQDFLTSERVQLMGLGARGAYITLLSQQWVKGDLPSEPVALARLCGCSGDEWAALWPELAPSFVENSGRLTNLRLEEEREKASRKRQRHVDAGKRGAQVRWSEEVNSTAIDTPKRGHRQPIASSESESDTETDKTISDPIGPAPARRVVKTNGDPYPPPAKCPPYPEAFELAWTFRPRREGGDPKKGAYRAWRARVRNGAEADAMARGLERYAAFCGERYPPEDRRFVMRTETFFGPDEQWLESWELEGREDNRITTDQWENI